jgi:hypothetical protein
MKIIDYSMLNDDWEVVGDNGFVSPLNAKQGGQMIIFPEIVKNGSISADITPLEGHPLQSGERSSEASIVFRYGGQDAYYYAGLAAFKTKFFIAKTITGPAYFLRQWVGGSNSIKFGKKYRLRVEFNGSQIVFYENNVQQFVLLDEEYGRGQWGLAAWKCKARFENVELRVAQPVAFVVMPFASELKFVYGVIKETVESYGVRCERADESFISSPVMEEVKKRIAGADLVIVDFTGKNPNVYYEAGLADAWKKDWIVLAQASEDMTFDVRHIGSIRYNNAMGADKSLRVDLQKALQALRYRKPVDQLEHSVQGEPEEAEALVDATGTPKKRLRNARQGKSKIGGLNP